MTGRLQLFAEIITTEFPTLIAEPPDVSPTRLRVRLVDSTLLEIRYPREDEFSFHWQQADEPTRLNTAPHHPDLSTFPRHLHIGGRVEEDHITSSEASPEDNLRSVLHFIQHRIKPDKPKGG